MSDYDYQEDLSDELLWQQNAEFQKIRDLQNRRDELTRRFHKGDNVKDELIRVIDELKRLEG